MKSLRTMSDLDPSSQISQSEYKIEDFSAINNPNDLSEFLNQKNFLRDSLDKVLGVAHNVVRVKLRWLALGALALGVGYASLHHDDTPPKESIPDSELNQRIEKQCRDSLPNIHNLDPAKVVVIMQKCIEEHKYEPLPSMNSSNQ